MGMLGLHMHLGRGLAALFARDVEAAGRHLALAGQRLRRAALDLLDPAVGQRVVDGAALVWVRVQHLEDAALLAVVRQRGEQGPALRVGVLVDRGWIRGAREESVPALA